MGPERKPGPLGSDGMWWILNSLIEALVDPASASIRPRIRTLGTTLGGPATQAALEHGDAGVRIVWRRLRGGVVGDVIAAQDLTFERAEGWLGGSWPKFERRSKLSGLTASGFARLASRTSRPEPERGALEHLTWSARQRVERRRC